MNDHDALVASICDQPEEDTPRLIYADWLEENDRSPQAEFIRAQVEFARTLPWEPFAVLCRWRRNEWFTGRPFRNLLPRVDGFQVEWPEDAFHRGLAWRINVRSLIVWERLAPFLYSQAPIGAMHLWSAATLEDWQRFTKLPGLERVRKLSFQSSPIEPLRVLREAPATQGVNDISFLRSNGAGMAFVLEELLAAPLGQNLRGLHFHMGNFELLEDLIDTLHSGARLERLTLSAMELTDGLMERLMAGPAVRNLTELNLRGNVLGGEGFRNIALRLPPSLHTLALPLTSRGGRGISALAEMPNNLRRLDLSTNVLPPRAARALARSAHLAGLRSLSLRLCGIGERQLDHLTRAKFWPNLVEIDLRENPIPNSDVRPLLDAEVPPDLTALVLTGEQLGTESRNELQRKYGERVVFVPSEIAGL